MHFGNYEQQDKRVGFCDSFEKGYQEKAATILLDRLKNCDPADMLSIVLALKELFEPTYNETLSIGHTEEIECEDGLSDKRHWKRV